jgi:hypothetical protein
MTTTGDVAPVMVGVAPALMAKRRQAVNKKPQKLQKPKRKAIESILRPWALDEDDKSLIPDTAQEITTDQDITGEPEIDKTPQDNIPGHEELLQTSLALVAPDTTPNMAKELDPSLVPSKDPALDTLLGTPGKTYPTPTPSPRVPTGESAVDMTVGLPSGDMPLPPGTFLPKVGGRMLESEERPRVELAVGSLNSVVGSGTAALGTGELGVSAMPPPKEANVAKTMDTFRRYMSPNI